MSNPKILDDLKKFCAAFAAQFVSELELQLFAARPHACFYHYTNGVGLKGILENQELWFTDYRYLNDPKEFSHGLDIIDKVIQQVAPNAHEHARLALDVVSELMLKKLSESFQYYITSLSTDGDELGQWRSYADNGKGYAIGFSSELISIKKPTNFYIGDIQYEDSDVTDRVRDTVQTIVRGFLDTVTLHPVILTDEKLRRDVLENLTASAAPQLVWHSINTKHSAYAHEKEVRLIKIDADDDMISEVSTRVRGSEIVPYMKQKFPLKRANSITEIIVGPATSADSVRSVRTLLKTLKYPDEIKIKRSDIPYRALT